MGTFQTFLSGILGEWSSLPSSVFLEMYNVLQACLFNAIYARKAETNLFFSQAPRKSMHSTNHSETTHPFILLLIHSIKFY